MTELARTATSKFRLLSPEGIAVEFFSYSDTTPEEVESLVENNKYLIEKALEGGFLVPNATAATKAVQGAKADGMKERFGVRADNDLHKIVSMDVDPQRDGRVKVSFYGDSFKQPRDDYASASLLLAPSDMVEALSKYYTFQIATFQKIATFSVDFYVETYLSTKMNQNGKPYKNVPKGGIHVAEGAAPPALAEAPAPPAPPPAEQPVAEQQDIPF
ncbi:MAG: hypothetical protein ACYSW8_25115 [Planctomycetota bacterium]|jgi:hypothetical protein